MNERCRPSNCFDGVLNGSEGDVDCGGQRAIRAGQPLYATCVRLAGGEVKCFGDNDSGQLGYGDQVSRIGPETLGNALLTVPLPEPIEHIYAGHHISCAVSVTGSAYCWGLNRDGQLGAGHQRNIGDEPDEMGQNLASIQLPGDQPIRALCLGAQHVCALDLSGAVLCWGSNTRGQLGQNDRVFRGTTPESIDTLTPVNLGQSATAITQATYIPVHHRRHS